MTDCREHSDSSEELLTNQTYLASSDHSISDQNLYTEIPFLNRYTTFNHSTSQDSYLHRQRASDEAVPLYAGDGASLGDVDWLELTHRVYQNSHQPTAFGEESGDAGNKKLNKKDII